MSATPITPTPPAPEVPPSTRVGDVAAMLRIMHPLHSQLIDPVVGRRRLLADLCRFIGVQVGSLPPESIGFPPEIPAGPNPADNAARFTTTDDDLTPRQEQTLKHLLSGDSEKQVARKLQLSQHTVHVYVKALYRHFGVSSRGELLAKHLARS